jgi:hypothetical protein
MVTDSYHIDLEQFSVERFQEIIENSEMLPSRKILQEKTSERFALLKLMEIHNLQELVNALNSKKHIEQFAQRSGIIKEYLEILSRQTKIYTPVPVTLKAFPGIDTRHIEGLAALGIRNSRQLLRVAKTVDERNILSTQVGVPETALLELVQLSDLVRAGWVGPIFARLIYEADVCSVQVLAIQSPQALFTQLCLINKEQKLTDTVFTLKDITSCIEIARMLPTVMIN